jgi:hypothetical protein
MSFSFVFELSKIFRRFRIIPSFVARDMDVLASDGLAANQPDQLPFPDFSLFLCFEFGLENLQRVT